jgi:hypothetical protein
MTSFIGNSGEVILSGEYRFSAQMDGYSKLEDIYQLRITIPKDFPYSIPTIQDVQNKIKRIDDNHIDKNGIFCLGSNFRLFSILLIPATPKL